MKLEATIIYMRGRRIPQDVIKESRFTLTEEAVGDRRQAMIEVAHSLLARSASRTPVPSDTQQINIVIWNTEK